jgi:hypothetical protein
MLQIFFLFIPSATVCRGEKFFISVSVVNGYYRVNIYNFCFDLFNGGNGPIFAEGIAMLHGRKIIIGRSTIV